MPTLTSLVLDKQYADKNKLNEAQLDAAYNSIVDYINEKIKTNLLSAVIDALGADYSFDNDGIANYTNSLFEKQYAAASYNGGDISIGVSTDVGWISVDAVNVSIAFEPERAGKYKVVFDFTHTLQLNNTSEGKGEVLFRISDGTTASKTVRSGGYFPAPAANAVRLVNPISISHIFDWDDNPKTIVLQKWVKSATNIATNQVSATTDTGEVYMSCEKI